MNDNSNEVQDPTRRTFLKLGVLGAGAAVVGGLGYQANRLKLFSSTESNIPGINPETVPDDPKHHWGFMIDLAKCDGCENLEAPADDPTGEKPRCSYACRKYHHFMGADPPQYWIRVYQIHGTKNLEPFFFPKPCQNCQHAPCKRVCPTGATYQRKDGTILINHEICIGCRICMAACPFETRFFWYKDPPACDSYCSDGYSPEYPVPHTKGTVAKCDFCIHKIYDGNLPHCVSACPRGALYFGDINEDVVTNGTETLPLNETLNARAGYRYKEDEGTQPSNYYLPKIKEEK